MTTICQIPLVYKTTWNTGHMCYIILAFKLGKWPPSEYGLSATGFRLEKPSSKLTSLTQI